ncbi:Outer membrane protein W precursor [Hyphomicrobium sulfonivorans]|uniref:Outer membrane protein W n=1 Tax=Hyphomicrobium sulfonivorans TaxID=121290 RepID=A0A125NW12_HYPSL|nr:OmpW family outer membrane protein [Hyphomicrobium sulfonivorans]KWT71549.1 Outer membrane protein W precursor [Hyphomicrobium sulfonivorans]
MGLKALMLGAATMATVAAASLATVIAGAMPAEAGDNTGNFMVRVLATGVLPDTDAGAISVNGVPTFASGSLDVPNEIIPALTLSYFFNKNVALELFCCFANLDVDGKGALAGTDVASTWIFPPALTLQYHFDPVAGLKPYVGAGVQYIAFFDTKSKALGGSMDIDNAWGFTLQAGVDVEIGQGWYLNADVKKTWLDTSWQINTGGNVLSGNIDVDPWIVSAGLGYRFNLEDIFGARTAEVPLK